MITVALSVTIGAPNDRVWRALTDPSERIVWDERILGEIVPSPERSKDTTRSSDIVPNKTKWRFRLRGVPLVMHDTTSEYVTNERIVSRISIGSMHFEQNLTLQREDDDTGPKTRLGMKLAAPNQIPVIGDVVQRLDVQKLMIEYADTSLRQIQKHCEADA